MFVNLISSKITVNNKTIYFQLVGVKDLSMHCSSFPSCLTYVLPIF